MSQHTYHMPSHLELWPFPCQCALHTFCKTLELLPPTRKVSTASRRLQQFFIFLYVAFCFSTYSFGVYNPQVLRAKFAPLPCLTWRLRTPELQLSSAFLWHNCLWFSPQLPCKTDIDYSWDMPGLCCSLHTTESQTGGWKFGSFFVPSFSIHQIWGNLLKSIYQLHIYW